MTAPGSVTRGGYALSAAAAAACLFVFAPRSDAIRFVAVTVPVVVVLLVVAALGVAAARSARASLLAVPAALALVAALLQLVQTGRDANWLGGNGSTVSFLGALALGFAALWLVARAWQEDPG